MTTFIKKNCLTLVGVSLITTSCKSQVNVYDGFETSVLSNIWAKDRMVNGALEMQSKIVRNGHGAAKITLKAGDVFEAGVGKSKDSERDELREARLVIAQWKQYCGSNGICSDDSPAMAIRYVNGKLYITIQTDLGEKTVYKTTDEIRNKWLDFKFKVRFSRLDTGQLDAWLNEKQIVNFKGITCYSSKKGYTEKSYFYFKTGLYRDIMPEPMSIYIDEYRKKELIE